MYLPCIKKRVMDNKLKLKADKQTKKFMKSARAFVAEKLTGDPAGKIPEEFKLNLILLETYYRTFISIDMEINELESLVIEGRYGPQPNTLLSVRDKACVRLESLMKQLGLTLKSGKQIGTTDIKKSDSPLERFMAQKSKS